MTSSLDFLSCILDEISLEGLDGITLETLWQRLRDRPHFPIAVDDDSKSYFWKSIAKLKDVEMYQLPKPREFVSIYDRYAYVDPDLDVVCEPAFKVQDPHYPIVPIKDGEVRGSCAMYRTRKCVTSKIHYSNDVLIMSLSQVVEEYGDYMVLVASPKARLLALIGSETNPLIDLSLEEYCLLERIGRSRYLGEVTQGENGLLALKAFFSKHLHYHRKKLTMKNLITKQDHHTKTKKASTSTGSLFHLKRFYVLRKTKVACLLKTICDILEGKPQNREACTKLRDQVGRKRCTNKNLFSKSFQKCLKTSTITCKELYPNGTKKEWYTVTGQEKMVKVLQLVKHCDEENSNEETGEGYQTVPLNVHFDYSKIAYGVPLLYQMYCLIKSAGPEGISSADLGRKMTLPKLDIRSLVRLLDRKGYISSIPHSIGRQTIYMYISTDYINKSETYSNHKEQEKRLINDERVINHSLKRKFDCKESTYGTSNVKKIKPEYDDAEKIILKYHEMQLKDSKRENILAVQFNNIKYKVHEITNKSKFLTESCNYENATDNFNISPIFSSTKQFTYRKLKRCNIILDLLKKDRIITTNGLQNHILQKEKKEGYNFTLDKKSVARLVDSLIENDKIKKVIVELEFEDKNTKIEFICDKSFQTSDPRLLLAIEQTKVKCFSELKQSNVDYLSEEKDLISQSKSNICTSIANNLGIPKQELYEIKPSQKYPHMTAKFVRVKALHIFLYYLVYQNKNKAVASDERITYHISMGWKRFVPPIPDYGQHGWFLIADIYSRMPLSLFVQLVNFEEEIPTLKDYLTNEETANYLINFLPKNLRNSLLKNRKYIFSISGAIRVLCYMGLVSIGPEIRKEKDQVFLFVHKKATLKDTTTSSPGYVHISTDIDYDTKPYEFKSEKDVEEYWQELGTICFHTPLGKYSTAIGRTLKIVHPAIKLELMSCTRNRHFDEVSDEGLVPGDGLGAAGYDSSLFLHIRRNWMASTANFKKKFQNSLKDKESSACSMQHLLKSTSVAKSSSRCRLQRITKHSPLLQEEERKWKLRKQSLTKELKHEVNITTALGIEIRKKMQKGKLCDSGGIKSKTGTIKSFGNKGKRQSNIKNCSQAKDVAKISHSQQSTITHRKKRGVKFVAIKQRPLKRAPFYDIKDKLALGKLDRFRCHWSPQEDSFLLLCKVASCFLQPTAYSRTIVVHYTIVRDLLHELVPGVSANKTSRACQRRMKYIMKNPTTVNNVKMFLEEALLDAELVKEFDSPKPPRTNVKVWKIIFTKLIDVLRKKIALPAMDRCMYVSIPQTLHQFNEKFEILSDNGIFRSKEVYKHPKSIEDIEKSALMFLILSAMAVEKEEQWTPLLNKIYQTYPESVLQSAVAHLRKEAVISVKSKAHRSDIRHLRQSTSPYKFSITYQNAKIAKFPRQNFEEAKTLLNSLNSLDSKSNIELKGNIPVGFIASILALLASERLHIDIQVPDQILLFDSTLSKKVRTDIVDRMASTLSDIESVELLQYLSNDRNFLVDDKDSTQTHLKSPQNSPGSDALQSPNSSVTDIELQTSEAQRSSKASRLALYMLRQELSQQTFEKEHHSQDYIVLNASTVFCRLNSSSALVLPMNPPEIIEETLSCETDHIEKQCTGLKRDRIVEISKLLTEYIPSSSLVMHNNYFEEIQALFAPLYQPQTVVDAKCIFSNLYNADQKGLSETELWRKFPNLLGELSLFEQLRVFREAFLILRVGVAGFTYVCSCFGSSWVLPFTQFTSNHFNKTHSFDCTQGEEITKTCVSFVENKANPTLHNRISPPNYSLTTQLEHEEFDLQGRYSQQLINSSRITVYFVPKTWRNPDGSLNKPVLFDLLFTLLSYLISTPGASTSKICEYFSLILPPIQVLELLEVLEHSDCIYKYYCRPIGKVSLFSAPPKTFITLNPKPGDIDHIEVFPDAVCKIAKLMDVVQ